MPYEKLIDEQHGREGVRKFGHFLSNLGNVIIAQSAGTSTGSYSYSGMTSNGTIYSGGGTVTVTDPYATQQALANAYAVNSAHRDQMNQSFMEDRAAIDANMRTTTLMPNRQIRGILTFELPHSLSNAAGGQPFTLTIQMGQDRHVLSGVMGQPGALPAIAPSPALAAYVAQQSQQMVQPPPISPDHAQAGMPPAAYAPRPSFGVASATNPDLPAMIQKTAGFFRTPMPLSDKVTLIRIEPQGDQLLLTARVDVPLSAISDDMRRRVETEMCGYPALMPLLHYGATTRIVYVGETGHDIGAVMVTREICGFR